MDSTRWCGGPFLIFDRDLFAIFTFNNISQSDVRSGFDIFHLKVDNIYGSSLIKRFPVSQLPNEGCSLPMSARAIRKKNLFTFKFDWLASIWNSLDQSSIVISALYLAISLFFLHYRSIGIEFSLKEF